MRTERDIEHTVVLPQGEDTLLQRLEVGPFVLRYASLRSSDSKDADQNGQDYLSFHISGNSLAFCVCDGVSQSYYGELASRFLGERLLDWLRAKMPYTMDETFLSAQMIQFLDDTRYLASREIRDHRVSEDITGLLAEVLEEKRRRGSETTFACGLVTLPDEWFPCGRVVLAWLGNCRLRWGEGSTWGCGLQDNPDDNKGRWNTKKGIVMGELMLRAFELAQESQRTTRRILAYTDGLAILDGKVEAPGDEQLAQLICEAANSKYSDDCSFLEIEAQRH